MISRYVPVSLAMMTLALPAAAAPVDSSELARCHAMATRDQQLECYEALAAIASSDPTTARAATKAPSGSASSASTASVGPSASGMTSAAGTAPSAGTAPAAGAPFNPADPANFGLSHRQLAPQPAGPSAVKSIVNQMTEDRLHNITVLLENGQTWTFIEPDPHLRPGDSVTIKRASLGSYLMLTPSRRSYRVERTK